MATKTFDPKNVSIIIGSHIVSGYADGSFITVERNNDTWTVMSGASGETVRSKSNDKTGRFTLNLMQSSMTNDVLTGFFLADELRNAGKFPVIVKEAGGATLAEATETWITKLPSVEFGKESGEREWILETGELVLFVGGIPT